MKKEKIVGLAPDTHTVTNEQGGEEAATSYAFDLVDPHAMFVLATVMAEGREKGYKKDNWRKIGVDSHLNHAIGHIMAYWAGDRQDDHLGHAFCRLMFAVAVSIEEEMT